MTGKKQGGVMSLCRLCGLMMSDLPWLQVSVVTEMFLDLSLPVSDEVRMSSSAAA